MSGTDITVPPSEQSNCGRTPNTDPTGHATWKGPVIKEGWPKIPAACGPSQWQRPRQRKQFDCRTFWDENETYTK